MEHKFEWFLLPEQVKSTESSNKREIFGLEKKLKAAQCFQKVWAAQGEHWLHSRDFFCFCFVLVSIPQPFPGTRSCLNLQHDKAPATLTWPSPSLPEQPGQDCPHPAPGNGHRSSEKQRLQIQDGMKIHIYPFFFSFVVPSMKSTQALRCFLFTAFTWREEKALKILILIKQEYFPWISPTTTHT